MIECPICHVMNEEQAHFCSECGQRFAPTSTQTTFQNPNAPAADPVFPNFPPADKTQFPQPQAVQEYQQSSNAGNQFDNSGFGGPPANPPGYGAPQQAGFNPPQTPAFDPPQTPVFNPPNAPPFNNPNPQGPPVDAPGSGFDSSSSAGFNAAQQPSGFNPPSSFNAPSNMNPNESVSSSASQETQSKTFPPEPDASSNPPLPARPKLHSPLFDGPEEPSARPQPPKSTAGFGGMNKPKGLRSPLLGEDDSEVETPKPRTGGLRSPLLRGEDDPDLPQRGKTSQRGPALPADDAPAPSKGKGGLRSPLLGGAEDDFVPQPKPVKPPKGLPPRTGNAHLRSPLLGGVDDYEGDEDDDDLPPVPGKTPFPHVRRPTLKDKDPVAEPMDQSSSGKLPGKSHLRSPLLGGADVDDEPAIAQQRPSGRQRLHSPIMDGPGGGGPQNFDSDYDEPYYEEIDDPNVLRSPLLAARSKHVAPEPASKITPAPAPPVQPVQPPAQPPVQPPAASFPTTNSFGEPATSSQAQPEFRDRGFPTPQPPGDMWRERGFAETRASEPKAAAPTPFSPPSPPEVAANIKESSPAPALRRSSRSGLLGGGADDIDEQPINNFRNAPPSQAKPAMILIIPCFLAVGAKLWYMGIMGQALTQSMPFLADQVMQLVVIIALIIFALTAGKR